MENNDNILKAKIEQLVSENQSLKQELRSVRVFIDKMGSDTSKAIAHNEELEQFTYVATHDLKTPLSNISGYLELLEIELENPNNEVQDSVKWLKYSVKEAMNVINELTMALKARSNNEEQLTLIDLNELVESILSGMRSKILEKKIVFLCDFTEVDKIMYYPVALRSILQNLISNSIQYSDPLKDGEIIVRTVLHEHDVCISIQDNGLGIDLEVNRDKLLGLFKRVTNDGSGSGIGMYIINKSLENYGGKLEIESELGVGSTFSVILPNKTC